MLAVRESTDVSAARRAALRIAEGCGFDQTVCGNAGIVVTEAATNLLKHAGGGEIILRKSGRVLEIAAIDKGPGAADARLCFSDGYSTAGGKGTGLGAIARLTDFRDFYSVPGMGTVLVAHIGGTASEGAINVPYPGEDVCGDAWAIDTTAERWRMAVVDGLGHGIYAAEAARAAIELTGDARNGSPSVLIESMHLKVKGTRGAAAAAVDVSRTDNSVVFSGVGNVAGAILTGPQKRQQMISVNGTLGYDMRKPRQYSYPAEKNSLVVLHSDGLSTSWVLEKYPGLFGRHPAVIASVLFRDFRRLRDDATVVVKRIGIGA